MIFLQKTISYIYSHFIAMQNAMRTYRSGLSSNWLNGISWDHSCYMNIG